jgi:uncharacterized protein YegL
MGNGRFVNGKLHFVVSAAYVLTQTLRADWKTSLQNASDFLFAATGGQLQFGDVYFVDEDYGRLIADVVLVDTGTVSHATRGHFGETGQTVIYDEGDIGDLRRLPHELSHHIWGLGEEYSAPMTSLPIDKTNASPDNFTIPIRGGPANNTLSGDLALLRFAGGRDLSRSLISTNTPTQIVVVGAQPFPDLPTNCIEDVVWLQETSVSCGRPESTGADFCIMESGEPTFFCDASTHNPNQGTEQEVEHHMSCWEKIIATPGFEHFTVSTTLPADQPTPVNFIDLGKESRFAVVIDRSSSMTGDKLVYAKHGVMYWVESCTLADDSLSIIAYNSANQVLLPLTQANAIPSSLADDVDALTAAGTTNIRDALLEGVNQITSAPERAASQAVVLLTDGKHNRPIGTRLTEAVPRLLESGISAVAVGIGDGAQVDADDLDELADETQGLFQLVGVNDPTQIEQALIEANLFLQGTMLDTYPDEIVPAPPSHRRARSLTDRLYRRREAPTLEELLAALGISSGRLGSALDFGPFGDLFRLRNVYVEEGCGRVNFSINYPLKADFRIFLIDPRNRAVRPDGVNVREAGGGETHRLIVVNNPLRGSWKVVLFARGLPGHTPRARVTLSVGASNRKVVVVGGCDKSVYKRGEVPVVTASAKWVTGLTGLKVYVVVTSDTGETTRAVLRDGEPLSAEAGFYLARLRGLKEGKYRGVLHIVSSGKCLTADGLQMLKHSTGDLSLRSPAPKFHRVLPLYFQVT